MKTDLIARAVFFTIALPGVVALGVPCVILQRSGAMTTPQLTTKAIAAVCLWALSAAALLHSIWGFAAYGEGTLAPADPPKVLVVCGLYQRTRNPMYVAVVCMLLSEATYFRSWALLLYAVLAWLLFHAFVLCYEEPRLRDKFGVLWEQYGRAVPRWGIARRPYTPTTTQAGRRGGRQV